MTSTRKVKLQDRGAPEPKPSRKVVLDELLRSLQDLVNHELAIDVPLGDGADAPAPVPQTAAPAPAPPPSVAARPSAPAAPPAATADAAAGPESGLESGAGAEHPDTPEPAVPAPVSAAPGPPAAWTPTVPVDPRPAEVASPVTVEPAGAPLTARPSPPPAVIATHPGPEAKATARTGRPPPARQPDPGRSTARPASAGSAGASTPHADTPRPGRDRLGDTVVLNREQLPPIPAPAPAPAARPAMVVETPVPSGGEQQELPYLDLSPAAPAACVGTPEAEAPDTDARIGAMETDGPSDLPDLEHGSEPPPPPPATLTLTDGETGPSEIPLLEDAIDLDEPLDLPAAAPPATPPAAAGSAGRRMAVQIAARLNVELRQQGKPVLASEVIARLARLIEESLANGAANMENTRPRKP